MIIADRLRFRCGSSNFRWPVSCAFWLGINFAQQVNGLSTGCLVDFTTVFLGLFLCSLYCPWAQGAANGLHVY